MLTTLFYYGHYRDFFSKSSNAGHVWYPNSTRQNIIAPQDSVVMLNKARNDKIIDYAKELSSCIVGLKDAAKMYIYDMHLIERNGTVTFENHLQWVEEDLRGFITSYNHLQSVNTGHSRELGNFAHYIRNFTKINSEVLSHIGIVAYDDANLTYHGMGSMISHEAAKKAVNTFEQAYNAARGFLEQPLSRHMEFKGLDYYYNYTIGPMGNNTFGIIQSGMLIDVAV